MTKRYKSKALAALHETVCDFYEIGLIDAESINRFDKSCLVSVEHLNPSEIVETRIMTGVSQAVFANYLNVSVGSVSKWERGDKHPSGAALKLLDLVRRKGLEAIA